MTEYDLTTKDGIKLVHDSEFLPLEDKEEWKGWLDTYIEIIELVRSKSKEELASPDIQTQLWESTHIYRAVSL